MKIINKSGKDPGIVEDTFYVHLSQECEDEWEGSYFACESTEKYSTEEEAISDAFKGIVVAKVTLVAKIV